MDCKDPVVGLGGPGEGRTVRPALPCDGFASGAGAGRGLDTEQVFTASEHTGLLAVPLGLIPSFLDLLCLEIPA